MHGPSSQMACRARTVGPKIEKMQPYANCPRRHRRAWSTEWCEMVVTPRPAGLREMKMRWAIKSLPRPHFSENDDRATPNPPGAVASHCIKPHLLHVHAYLFLTSVVIEWSCFHGQLLVNQLLYRKNHFHSTIHRKLITIKDQNICRNYRAWDEVSAVTNQSTNQSNKNTPNWDQKRNAKYLNGEK